MAGEWRNATLDQLGRIVTGKTPPSSRKEYYGGSIPFVTPTDFDGRRTINDTGRYVTDHGADFVAGARIPALAVMVSCIGSDMGKAAIAGKGCITNQQINSIVVNADNDAVFVYYNLSTRKAEIRAAAGGSAQPILNKTAFGQLDILLPPLPEQRAIAHILGTLDDKIEANRRMSATLEAMARALFKSWFVDFEPVRAKSQGRDPGLPPHLAALFPDRLIETELGEIPAGWRFAPVSNFAQIKGGKQLDKQRFVEDGIVPVFGGAGLMGHTDEYNAEGYVICIGRVGAYCGRFFGHRGKAWINNNASWVSQFDGVPGEWLLLSLRHVDIDLIKKGAAQPFVSNSDLAAIPIVAPPVPVLTAFHKLAQPLFRREELIQSEVNALAALRDTLLPKLISGELRVKDAEHYLAGVV